MTTDIETEIKNLNSRLQKLNDGITLMREAGLDEEILIAYLCYNLHMSRKEVKKIMDCYEEFYEKVIKKWTIKKLKE